MNRFAISKLIYLVSNEGNAYYDAGWKNFGSKSVLLGMSPGNGYFTEWRMESIIHAFCRKVPRVYVLIPDSPHVYNFIGMGYADENAVKKAKKDINQTQNRLARALDRLQEFDNIQIIDWDEDIAASKVYQSAFVKVVERYTVDSDFKSIIDSVVSEYLTARSGERTVISMNIEKGAMYYLAELALFVHQADIFGEELTVAYYKKWGQGLDTIASIFHGFQERFSMIQYIFEDECCG